MPPTPLAQLLLPEICADALPLAGASLSRLRESGSAAYDRSRSAAGIAFHLEDLLDQSGCSVRGNPPKTAPS
jgi:hypothetical protein